jgi:hypothetical protein
VTRIQYLSLFMVLTVPHTGQMSSPPLFCTFCLWSAPGLVKYLQDRLTARVGDQGLPRLRYNVSVRDSVMGHLDRWTHTDTVPTQSKPHLDRP